MNWLISYRSYQIAKGKRPDLQIDGELQFDPQ